MHQPKQNRQTKQTGEVTAASRCNNFHDLFVGGLGLFLGISFLKFGNPPIMEKWVTAPANIYELIFGYPWPISWAYVGLGALVLLSLKALPLQLPPARAVWALLLCWLTWQVASSLQAVDQNLASATLKHFAACVVCFWLGISGLARVRLTTSFWMGLLLPFAIVLAVGWEQHFGGLEQTRRYFFLYIYPQLTEPAPEYLKKMSSDRIFGTLFYPNTLAGLIVLISPVFLLQLWRAGGDGRMTTAARGFLVILGGLAAGACLFWSGSKGGWLLMIGLSAFALLNLPLRKQLKFGIVLTILVLGLTGFLWRYAGFFQRGATSVSARFDYWQAAAATAAKEPILGTGPGTFAIPYGLIKRPESEMARLAHNDYLQQASDSGIPGALFYLGFVVLALWVGFRNLPRDYVDPGSPSSIRFALWLGVAGWAAQGLIEFPVYIPALAWTAFTCLGWLAAPPEDSGM